VLSGRGLCDELITRPEESYRLWWVVVCDLETSRIRRSWPALGRSAIAKKKLIWKGLSAGKVDEREEQCESQGGWKIGRNSNHVLSECSGNASYDSVQNLFILQFAIQKYKDENVQEYNFTAYIH